MRGRARGREDSLRGSVTLVGRAERASWGRKDSLRGSVSLAGRVERASWGREDSLCGSVSKGERLGAWAGPLCRSACRGEMKRPIWKRSLHCRR